MASAMAWAPTSVSQQPRLPQWQGRPSWVEAQVPDLAGVAADSLQLQATADHAGADADVAGDVDQVVDADADPAPVLGESTEVGVVGQRDRDVDAQHGPDDVAERDVDPVQVGREPDQAVAAPHQAGDADADADERRRHGHVGEHPADQAADGGAHLPGLAAVVDRRLHAGQHPTAEAHQGHERPVDAEVDGDHVGPAVGQPHPCRRTSGTGARHHGDGAPGHPQRLELGDQAGDRAPVETHQGGQLGARHLPRAVDVAQQRPEVVPPDGFLVGAETGGPLGGHRAPRPLPRSGDDARWRRRWRRAAAPLR